MKKGILFFLLLSNLVVWSQDASSDESVQVIDKTKDKTIYTQLDDAPQFVGGPFAMMLYIKKNTSYPQEAKENMVDGRVMVRLVIEKDGSVGDVEQVGFITSDTTDKMNDYGMIASATKLIKEMPKWQPGKHNGSAVRSQVVIPVIFKLN